MSAVHRAEHFVVYISILGRACSTIVFTFYTEVASAIHSPSFSVFSFECASERQTHTQIMRLSNVHFVVVVFLCAFHDANTYRECRVEKLFLL